MSDTHQPTEAQIAEVLEKYTPRQIAIAYLRASRRARSAETAFNIMDGLSEATLGLSKGDAKLATDGLKRSLRSARAHRQATE